MLPEENILLGKMSHLLSVKVLAQK